MFIADVPQRHGGVPEQAAPLRAPDRRAPIPFAKPLVVERQQVGQRGPRRLDTVGTRPRAEIWPAGASIGAVPRADLLADVAAEDVLADQRSHVRLDRATVLDRQVRDA